MAAIEHTKHDLQSHTHQCLGLCCCLPCLASPKPHRTYNSSNLPNLQFTKPTIHQTYNSSNLQFIKPTILQTYNSSNLQFIKPTIHQTYNYEESTRGSRLPWGIGRPSSSRGITRPSLQGTLPSPSSLRSSTGSKGAREQGGLPLHGKQGG